MFGLCVPGASVILISVFSVIPGRHELPDPESRSYSFRRPWIPASAANAARPE
jgi:hypothetical protein